MSKKSYGEFVKEAAESYGRLAQETSEIYKRYFINIPFDLNTFGENLNGSNANDLSAVTEKEFSKYGIKFDVRLTGMECSPGNNEYVKITPAQENMDIASAGMYGNEEDKYVSYMHANTKNHVMIKVPDGKNASINMLFQGSDVPLNTTIFIEVGNKSKVEIFEYYGSATSKPSVVGLIHEIKMGSDSELYVDSLHNEDANTINLAFSKNSMGDDSHLKLNSMYNGGAHTRVRNIIAATGKNSKIDVNEVMFGSGEQKFDISTYIINRGMHTIASLESKAVLMEKSYCIMKGFAKIEKGATKARSYVHERGILLDKNARVSGLPDMSVDENDVKATHSSATSPVDPESVFYLMSKGIDETGVKKLLVAGFFASSVSKMHNNVMKELSMSLINSKLETKGYGTIPQIDTRNMWMASDLEEKDMFKGHYKYRGAQ